MENGSPDIRWWSGAIPHLGPLVTPQPIRNPLFASGYPAEEDVALREMARCLTDFPAGSRDELGRSGPAFAFAARSARAARMKLAAMKLAASPLDRIAEDGAKATMIGECPPLDEAPGPHKRACRPFGAPRPSPAIRPLFDAPVILEQDRYVVAFMHRFGLAGAKAIENGRIRQQAEAMRAPRTLAYRDRAITPRSRHRQNGRSSRTGRSTKMTWRGSITGLFAVRPILSCLSRPSAEQPSIVPRQRCSSPIGDRCPWPR